MKLKESLKKSPNHEDLIEKGWKFELDTYYKKDYYIFYSNSYKLVYFSDEIEVIVSKSDWNYLNKILRKYRI